MIDWMTKNNRYARAARSLSNDDVKFSDEVLSTTRAHTLKSFFDCLCMKTVDAMQVRKTLRSLLTTRPTWNRQNENRFLSDAFVVVAVVAS